MILRRQRRGNGIKKGVYFLWETGYESDIGKCGDLKIRGENEKRTLCFLCAQKGVKKQFDGVGIGVNFVAF